MEWRRSGWRDFGEGNLTMEDGMTETIANSEPMLEATQAAILSDAGEDRNPVFGMLVSGDDDIVGLVAYSIYKQNKRDWLIAFLNAKGRQPNEDEKQSYILGDSTPRRLATFRHLAQATLEGRGPEVPFKPWQGLDGAARAYPIAQRPMLPVFGRTMSATSARISYLALGIVVLIAIYLAARFGLPGVPR